MEMIFLTNTDVSKKESLGIKKKIINQMKVFERNGIDISLISRSGKSFVEQKQNNSELLKINKIAYKFKYQKMFSFLSLCKNKQIDIYYRYSTSDILLAFSLTFQKIKGSRIFVEFPTYPYFGEFPNSIKGKLWFLIDRISFFLIKQLSDFFINCSDKRSIENKETIFLQNGVDINEYSFSRMNKQLSNNLVFLGNLSTWQGVDRIIISFFEFLTRTKNKNYYLTIIGDGPELEDLKKIANDSQYSNQVIFTGALSGKELTEELKEQDLAFSSSALDRKKMNRLSAIKTCEYAAAGLPFVLNYDDINFPTDVDLPFIIRMHMHEVNIEKSIKIFKDKLLSNLNLYELAKQYAHTHLSWNEKFQFVVDKILIN